MARTIFSHRVSAIAKIAVYFLAVILIGAVLSPPIFWLVQALAEHGMLKSIADFPFHRYFTRTIQVSALVLLVPLLFSLRIRKISEFGIEKNPLRIRDIVVGFTLALLPVILLAWVCIHFDVYRIRKDLDYSVLLKIARTAVFVAIIEEILFRGVLLGLAAKRLGALTGAILVSAVFAAVHFMRPAKGTEEMVHWWSGFAQLGSAFGALPAPSLLAFGFLSLFLVGLILSFARLSTRSLWLPIGLHAGWVLGQQSLQWFAKYRVKPEDALIPWVGPNVVSGAVPTGLGAVALLLLTGTTVWFYLRHGRKSAARTAA